MQLADELNLGFASNEDDTSDVMNWINAYDTHFKFIQDVTAHVYKDANSFFG